MKKEILNTLIDLQKINRLTGLIITGSTALDLLGCKIRREATDIDLYLPISRHYCLSGYKKLKDEDDYDEQNYQIRKYLDSKNNIKIDIFEPVSREKCIIRNNEEPTIQIQIDDCVFEVVKPEFILQFKIQHILSNKSDWKTKEKHRDDIIYFLQKNIV